MGLEYFSSFDFLLVGFMFCSIVRNLLILYSRKSLFFDLYFSLVNSKD